MKLIWYLSSFHMHGVVLFMMSSIAFPRKMELNMVVSFLFRDSSRLLHKQGDVFQRIPLLREVQTGSNRKSACGDCIRKSRLSWRVTCWSSISISFNFCFSPTCRYPFAPCLTICLHLVHALLKPLSMFSMLALSFDTKFRCVHMVVRKRSYGSHVFIKVLRH